VIDINLTDFTVTEFQNLCCISFNFQNWTQEHRKAATGWLEGKERIL